LKINDHGDQPTCWRKGSETKKDIVNLGTHMTWKGWPLLESWAQNY